MKIKRRYLLTIPLLSGAVVIGTLICRYDNLGDRNHATVGEAKKTRSKDREEPDEKKKERMRREATDQAAQQWYERLLDKHPYMRPTFRDVPDDQNGYLQFVRFAESLGKDRLLSPEIDAMFRGDAAWDPAKSKAWFLENQAHLDRLLLIAELPDRSVKGIPFDKLHSMRYPSLDGLALLRAYGRLEMEAGNLDSAIRYLKASTSLADHFVDIEVPNMLGEVIAAGARSKAQNFFREEILLSANTANLASWNEVLRGSESFANEYKRVIIGEWNFAMRTVLLPLLVENRATQDGLRISDVEGFTAAYAAAMKNSAEGISAMGPGRFDVESARFEMTTSDLDDESVKAARESLRALSGITEALGSGLTETTMDSGAIALISGKEMPLDPVSGKPFRWDPATRTLSAPEGVKGVDPVHVP